MNLIDKKYCYINQVYGQLQDFNYIDQYVEIKLRISTNLNDVEYDCNIIQFESEDYGETWLLNKDKNNGVVFNNKLNKANNEFSIKVKRKLNHSYSVKFKFVVFVDDNKKIMISSDSNIIPIPYYIYYNNESIVYSNYLEIGPGFYDLKIDVVDNPKSDYQLPPKQIVWQEYNSAYKTWKDINHNKTNYVIYNDNDSDTNRIYRAGMWFKHKYNSDMSWLIYGEPFILINSKKKHNPLHITIDQQPQTYISPKLCGRILDYLSDNIVVLRSNKFKDDKYIDMIYNYFYNSPYYQSEVKYYDYANIITEVAYFKNEYEFIDIYLVPNYDTEFINQDKKTNNLSFIIKRQVD